MYIIHGENTTKSRQKLAILIRQAKLEKKPVTILPAQKITLGQIEEAFASQGLFSRQSLVIIEELHSLPRSKRKNELISAVSSYDSRPNKDVSIILWEKRILTAAMKKKFPTAKFEEFKSSNYLFSFLDTLNGKKENLQKQLSLLEKVLQTDGEFFCFAMICRQIRLLISAKEGATIKAPPFVISKIKKQAQTFSLNQLLHAHTQLAQIDAKTKQSLSPLSIKQQLEFFIITL